MLKSLISFSNNRSSVFLLVLALIVGGVGAQATGLLNTKSGGYLVCVNSATKIVTHPGTSKCPKGSKKLILGAQGAAGAIGLTGAAGLSGRDGIDGVNGKTLWNGTIDPLDQWGAAGDFYINYVSKTLFGPKSYNQSWPAGVSLVGPKGDQGLIGLTGAKGDQGPIGLTGATGAQGPSGGSGPAGATGATGPAGAASAGGSKITELSICGADGTSLCTIGSQGPGGGLIFFVDYFDQYADFNYLEAAPTDGLFAAGAATGPWSTTHPGCGELSNLTCWDNSIYTETDTALATIKGLHRGLGGGQAATNAIIAKHSGVALDLFAAGVADSYTAPSFNGVTKSDYYLPTKDEIELMHKNLNSVGVGGFVAYHYWSSSEAFATNAWNQNFLSGTLTSNRKGLSNNSTDYHVRPVRAF